ncbi:hypothetical protein BSKO_10556 [Bryopsis sp. KO-2023]|nr:hypothetical protein BSKO_10556 [Bryopsis sp. KO-2023]
MVEEEPLSATAFRQAEKKFQLHRTQKLQLSKGRLRGKGWVEKETDFSEVIDVRGCDDTTIQENGMKLTSAPAAHQKIYSCENHPGFYLLPGALTLEEQVNLIEAAWVDFPNPPAKTNLFNQYGDLPNLFEAAASGLHLQTQTQAETPLSRAHPATNSTAETSEAANMLEVSQDLENSECCEEGSVSMGCSEMAVQPRLVRDGGGGEPSISNSSEGNCASDSMGVEEPPLDRQRQSNTHWVRHSGGPSAKTLLRKLRWATLGPHFDWTEREYVTSKPYRQLPEQLEAIGLRFADMVGIPFKPDAALVNYYYKGSTIGGHKDDAEQDMSQPIVSLSLGCPAVFLMGGETRDVPPTPLFLHSGDAVILSGAARGCYHGVPRVLVAGDQQQIEGFGLTSEDEPEKLSRFSERMQHTRINISIRNVLQT